MRLPFHLTHQQASCRLHAEPDIVVGPAALHWPVCLFLIRRLKGPHFPREACLCCKHAPLTQEPSNFQNRCYHKCYFEILERGSVLASTCPPPHSVAQVLALHTQVQAMENMKKPCCFLRVRNVVVAFDCCHSNAAAFPLGVCIEAVVDQGRAPYKFALYQHLHREYMHHDFYGEALNTYCGI